MPATGPICTGCVLASLGRGFTEVEVGARYQQTRLMVIGEASGDAEARESLPFRPHAQSGSLLADALRQTNISRAEIAITNILRCFPRDVVVEAPGISKAFRRWYRGEMLTITTDRGVLTGTPNHPALTDKGWIALGELKEGEYLVRGPDSQGITDGKPNINRNPTRFDELFDSLSGLFAGRRVVGTRMDFHGDGEESEVEVIAQDGFLWDNVEAAHFKHLSQDDLLGANFSSLAKRASYRHFVAKAWRNAIKTYSDVRGPRDTLASLGSHDGHTDTQSVAVVAYRNALISKCISKPSLPNLGLLRECFKRSSSEIPLAKILKIERASFAGHVYNLQTHDEQYIANGFIVHNCHPPQDALEGMWYQERAISTCTERYLAAEIQRLRPRVILALGGTAFRTLTQGIKGKAGTLDYIRGFALAGAGAAAGIPVVAGYHPAYIRRGASHLTPLLHRDLRRAWLMATGQLTSGKHYSLDPLSDASGLKYQTLPSEIEARRWFENIDSARPIYFDIETPKSRREDEDARTSFADRDIIMIQFSQRRGEGIALPWRDGFMNIAREVLRTPNRKVGHNAWNFDIPVLEANDVEVRGEIDDTMIMWKHYHADLPANLQAVAGYCGFPFPWKHLNESDPEFYGCVDVDATCWADETLQTILKREGRWDGYLRYFRDVHPILFGMSRRGIPISEPARVELRDTVIAAGIETDAEIKRIVPEEVLATKQKYGYKNPPILKCVDCGWKGRVDHECTVTITPSSDDDETSSGDTLSTTTSHVTYQSLAEENGLALREITIRENEKCRCTKKSRESCDVCGGTGMMVAGTVEMRWAALTEFNPNSAPQVKRFMRYMKHPVPKHAKRVDASGEAAETTEVKELERLWTTTKHPIYPLLIRKRRLTKVMGTYVEGWQPGRDGRIHTTFTFQPATWQTSSREPNVQNGLKHGKDLFQKSLAKGFASMQVALPGYRLVDFDFKSFHAQTTACVFELKDYLRLAKIDIHSFVTCHYLKLPERVGLYELPDDEMRAVFKRLKKDEAFKFCRDYKSKRTILGIQFAMYYRKLFQLNREDFEGEWEAKRLWELIMVDLFPGLKTGQDRQRALAKEQGYLDSRYGARRRFYDVERWDRKRQKMVGGDQAEAAVAFEPAANAFGMVRETMLMLEELGALEKYGLINSIHDSLRFHCPDGLVDECVAVVKPVMERNVAKLVYPKILAAANGLSVEAEVAVGRSLAAMEEYNN